MLRNIPDGFIGSWYAGIAIADPVEQPTGDSPFAGLVQETRLTFYVPDGEFVIDPDTGVEVARDRIVTVYAYLPQKRQPTETELPGTNASSIFLKGYCMRPTILPNGVAAGMVADYYLKPEYGTAVRGKFIFHRTPPSSFGLVQELVGDQISGMLNIDG